MILTNDLMTSPVDCTGASYYESNILRRYSHRSLMFLLYK